MAYGPFNSGSGGGITKRDLEQLKAEIMSGELTTPLCTTVGGEILTVSGEDILAYQNRSAGAIKSYIDKAVATAMAAVYASTDKAILAV